MADGIDKGDETQGWTRKANNKWNERDECDARELKEIEKAVSDLDYKPLPAPPTFSLHVVIYTTAFLLLHIVLLFYSRTEAFHRYGYSGIKYALPRLARRRRRQSSQHYE